MSTSYNGWKNHQTWNVALWISNDKPLYLEAVRFLKKYKGRHPYSAFIRSLGLSRDHTLDNIKWFDSCLDYDELNEMMWEFVS